MGAGGDSRENSAGRRAGDVSAAHPGLLIGSLLFPCQLLAVGFLGWHENLHVGKREGQKAQILQQPTPGREGVGLMDAAAVGVTEKEDREQPVDQQDIFYRMVFVLAAITLGLFRRILGADDAPLGAVMGKRGEASVSFIK